MRSVGPIFISYAREDATFFHSIRTRSSKPLSTFWWDARIKRSDPNWQAEIDKAIMRSSAVFVLCSPNSRRSSAVSAEVELAQSYDKPIYALWIAGETWARSAPFSLVTYNYTDCRKDEKEIGLIIDSIVDEVVDDWPRMFEKEANSEWHGLGIQILCKIEIDRRVIYCAPGSFDYFFEVLQELYSRFLREQFSPFSYGSEWCLCCGDYLLLPATWALEQGVSVTVRSDGYMELPPVDLGIMPGSTFTVRDIKQIMLECRICGFFIPKLLWKFTHMFGSKFAVTARKINVEELSSIDLTSMMQVCMDVSQVNWVPHEKPKVEPLDHILPDKPEKKQLSTVIKFVRWFTGMPKVSNATKQPLPLPSRKFGTGSIYIVSKNLDRMPYDR